MHIKKETIITQTYDLLKDSISIINRFPRSQKFTLGDRIQNKISDVLELYIKAFFSPKKDKLPLLHEANISLEIIRHYFRLAFDLGFYSSTRYHDLAQKIHEIGKMTGGWIKSLQK